MAVFRLAETMDFSQTEIFFDVLVSNTVSPDRPIIEVSDMM